MKRSKKFVVGIVLIIVGMLGFISAFGYDHDKVKIIVGSIIFVAVGIALISIAKEKIYSTEQPEQQIQQDIKSYIDSLPNCICTNLPFDAPKQGESVYPRIFKVAGVTFNNRQEYLKTVLEMQNRGESIVILLEQYDYNGENAIRIVVNDMDIGNIPRKNVKYLIDNKEYLRNIFKLYVGTINDDNGTTRYYAQVKINVAKKI